MKHVLENHGDDFKVTQELEITTQGKHAFISARDFVNFPDVLTQSDEVINVDVRLTEEDIKGLIDVLKIVRHKLITTRN